VLGRVRERFRNDVIGGEFGRLRQPSVDGEVEVKVEVDEDGGAAGQCCQATTNVLSR